MFPEKHLKDLESSERKSKILRNFSVTVLFLSSFVLLGPLLHELSHIAVLGLQNCDYVFNIGFVLPNGINAQVSPLCAISSGYLLIFYTIGYFITLSAGVVLNITGSILNQKSYSSYLTALGTGTLLSVILTIGIEGDIQNALEVMKLDPVYGSWIALFIIFGVFATSLQGFQNLLDLERKEGDTD